MLYSKGRLVDCSKETLMVLQCVLKFIYLFCIDLDAGGKKLFFY